ncbi:MAG: hypothetical protein COA38_05075 [Fluviicola sp.]|nr:MAG: hypothetical protein COA38_05075 [Fluviicola sp.]
MKSILPIFCYFLLLSCGGVNSERIEAVLANEIVAEKSLQFENAVLFDQGNEMIANVRDELARTPKKNNSRLKLMLVLAKMQELASISDSFLLELEGLKVSLLDAAGEDDETIMFNTSKAIARRFKGRKKRYSCSEANLWALKNRDNRESVNDYFINVSGNSPSKRGLELWEKFNGFNLGFIKSMASYEMYGRKYTFLSKNINSFSDQKDLHYQVKRMIYDGNKVNNFEDFSALRDVYMVLSKPEQVKIGELDRHWVVATFKDASIVQAIMRITQIENEVLTARKYAFENWMNKVQYGRFSYNLHEPVITGPESINLGERIDLIVSTSLNDQYNRVKVETDQPDARIKYNEDGTATISFIPQKGQKSISGKHIIKDSKGIDCTKEWKYNLKR